MKQYIVTEKQLRKLKDIFDSDAFAEYWSEETRELKWIVEDIEGTELTFKPVLDRLACMLTCHVNSWQKDKNTYSLIKSFEDIAVATLFFPRLERVDWRKVWDEAAKVKVEEEPAAAYDVFMKALEGKDER